MFNYFFYLSIRKLGTRIFSHLASDKQAIGYESLYYFSNKIMYISKTFINDIPSI